MEAEMKQRMHEMWTRTAAGYAESVIDSHFVTGLFPKFAEWLAPQLQGRPGARILDVAAASGEPAATLAAALPGAHVVSTDLAAPFAELGRARAARQGLTNMSFETADGEDLSGYSDASFDAVVCCLGLMFMPAHEKALAEFARVLKPGGLLALAVWGREEGMPFFRVISTVTAEYDPEAVPAAGGGLALRFGDPAAGLVPDLEAAGLRGVAVETLDLCIGLPADVWWDRLLAIPLPLQPALAKAAAARGQGVWEEARGRLAALLADRGFLAEDGAMRIPGNHCHFVTARKP